jgi:uncharacterized protein (DUF58 family)
MCQIHFFFVAVVIYL